MVMRHMKKYIPGNPRLVFRHVSGAGGSVGANFLAEAGKKNGYMMGVFTIPIMGQVMKETKGKGNPGVISTIIKKKFKIS